ncbi:uncharacterized protein LOC101861644 [Aplysia californica]|uniref:Uncharacterized protein LOC101861644 n=1 Tax=Aplysia californica TaxID=6500 RepID=A0ABM0JF52_APLCA|nr:uncharacterized protein LOC101861644 [Aplysia californica]
MLGKCLRKINTIPSAEDTDKRSFQVKDCLFHHDDLTDFTVFEFGLRVVYTVWRALCSPLLLLLTYSEWAELVTDFTPSATPYAALSYMHVWLVLLLTVSGFVDALVLTVSLKTTTTSDLARQVKMPLGFILIWALYNTVCANVLSCLLMYIVFLDTAIVHSSVFYLCMALSGYTVIHVATTSIPSRVEHCLQPVLLTLLHVCFTAVYQAIGGSDPQGNNYVYRGMDWGGNSLKAFLVALAWLTLTFISHLLVVACSKLRRATFRYLRVRRGQGQETDSNKDPLPETARQPSPPEFWVENLPHGHKRLHVGTPQQLLTGLPTTPQQLLTGLPTTPQQQQQQTATPKYHAPSTPFLPETAYGQTLYEQRLFQICRETTGPRCTPCGGFCSVLPGFLQPQAGAPIPQSAPEPSLPLPHQYSHPPPPHQYHHPPPPLLPHPPPPHWYLYLPPPLQHHPFCQNPHPPPPPPHHAHQTSSIPSPTPQYRLAAGPPLSPGSYLCHPDSVSADGNSRMYKCFPENHQGPPLPAGHVVTCGPRGGNCPLSRQPPLKPSYYDDCKRKMTSRLPCDCSTTSESDEEQQEEKDEE